MINFTVIDTTTNEYPDLEKIALTEDWAKHLMYCDMEGFAISEEGELLLLDECSGVAYCPSDRFKVVYYEDEEPSMYYVIRDKNTGLYFRGKGVNRWGKHYNQASIYRVRGMAEHTIKEVAWHGEQAEIVPIRIVEVEDTINE